MPGDHYNQPIMQGGGAMPHPHGHMMQGPMSTGIMPPRTGEDSDYTNSRNHIHNALSKKEISLANCGFMVLQDYCHGCIVGLQGPSQCVNDEESNLFSPPAKRRMLPHPQPAPKYPNNQAIAM